MQKYIATLLASLGFLTFVSAEQYALLVGVGAHIEPANDRGKVAENDCRLMRQLLTEKFGFKTQNIVTLLDQRATKANVIATFQSHLIRQAKSGDSVVFFFDGHGGQVRDFNGDEADGLDEALVTYDMVERPETWFTDDILGQLINQLQTNKVLVVTGACHSGTVTKSLSGTFRPDSVDFGFLPTSRGKEKGAVFSETVTGNHVLVSGCSADQVCYRNKQNNILVRFFFDTIQQSGPDITFSALHRQLLSEFGRISLPTKVTPQLEGQKSATMSRFLASENVRVVRRAPAQTTGNLPNQNILLRLNTNGNVFRPGDEVTVSVQANQDCHLRLYFMNSEGEIHLIFPNQFRQNDQIRGGENVQLPSASDTFAFEVSAPFGSEVLKAVASSSPFRDNFDPKKLFPKVRTNGLDQLTTSVVASGGNFGEATVVYRVLDPKR